AESTVPIFRVAGTYRLVLSAPLSSGWSVSRPVGCNGLPGDRHAMGAWSGTTDGRRRHHTVAQSVRGGSDGAQLSWMDDYADADTAEITVTSDLGDVLTGKIEATGASTKKAV